MKKTSVRRRLSLDIELMMVIWLRLSDMLGIYWGLTFNNQCIFHQDDFAIDDSEGDDSDKRTDDKMSE